MTIPQAVTDVLLAHGYDGDVTEQPLTGGNVNRASRLTTVSGQTFVLKQHDAPPERLFACEAAGLAALRGAGARTPDVIAVGPRFLLLEDLGVQPEHEPDWAAFGRAIAHVHQHHALRFGFEEDNFLGPLPQLNPWTDDGHVFFGQYRVLRYLSEPLCEQALTPEDRRGVERLVQRLPELVPPQRPSLLHGDYWQTNMMVDAAGTPAMIDPAVYYGWPEAELAQTRQYGPVSQAFYDAYNEVNPLEPGWWERLELLQIRQCMAVLAFFGNIYNTLDELRAIVAKFS